ncbi:hypothetical protein CASFOL_029001 [Castilleja foliolosa]|uniref:PARP catalytic domain-containing protein n=1 Tax=Castilleja foliolosa TaxID=1961234 RepID=A0ABD3CCT5_9LAMI
MDNHGAQEHDSVTVHDYEGTSTPTDSDGDTSPSSSSPVLFREFVESGMLLLVPVEERENNVVIKNISKEVEIIYGEGTVVVAVHEIKYTGQVRLECFRQAVAARRGGDANVQYGWYGGSRAEICDILRYGFGRCGIFDEGLSHGVGVYLSPENNQLDSVMRTREDENGIRHMLLCRIILGKTENIRAGSEQVYPSSTEFDTGVDNPLEPSTYIIWSAYMNSHILPVSIFSFKEPSVPQGMGMGAGPGGGSGPTAAAAAAAQKQETLLQRVDTNIANLVDKFGSIVNVARVIDTVGDDGLDVIGSSCPFLEEIQVFSFDPDHRNNEEGVTKLGLLSVPRCCCKLHYVLYFCRKMTNAPVVSVVRHCPDFTHFRLCIMDPRQPDYITNQPMDEAFGAVAKTCPNLKRLSLSVSGLLTDLTFEYIATHCSNLTELDIQDSVTEDIDGDWLSCFPQNFTSLETLNIASFNTWASFDVLEQLVSRCKSLRVLKVNGHTRLDQLRRLLVHAPQLTELGTGSFCQQLTPHQYEEAESDELTELHPHISNLRRLWVIDTVGDDGLDVIESSCPFLEEIRVFPFDPDHRNNEEGVTKLGLLSVPRCCCKLHYVLYFCRKMTNASVVSVVRHCPDFTHFRLCIMDPRQPMEEAFAAVAKTCPNLKLLSVSGLLTALTFEYIGKYPKKLETLSVAFAGGTDWGMQCVLEGCPKLRIRDSPYGNAALSLSSCFSQLPDLLKVNFGFSAETVKLVQVQNRSNTISKTVIISFIKNEKIYSVADGLSLYSDTSPACGTHHKIKVFRRKIAAAVSGDYFSAKSLFGLLKTKSRDVEEFSKLCDIIADYGDKWAAGRKVKGKAKEFPCVFVMMGFDEVRNSLVIDRVIDSELGRTKYTAESAYCVQGSGKMFAEKHFRSLSSLGFFDTEDDDQVFIGLRCCVLYACIHSPSCGGWLTECLVEKEKAELFELEHVVTLLKEHFEVLILGDRRLLNSYLINFEQWT